MATSIDQAAADVTGEGAVLSTKRQKLCDSAEEYTTSSSHPSIDGSKGVAASDAPKEWVIQIPPRLTKSAYQVLLACHAAPRQWHLEGRFGSRTNVIIKGESNGIPILYNEDQMKKMSLESDDLRDLLKTEGVTVVETNFVQNHRTKDVAPEIDARIHPELEPAGYKIPNIKQTWPFEKQKGGTAFTYAEMFAGIGGFGVALEALGGKCVFYSELLEDCQSTYKLNFPDTNHNCIHGDIYEVPDSAFPQHLDLLVAGFPCQPFSNLGEQPGFNCEKGRGHLFLQIVRALKLSQPKAFLLENVPGLLGMKDTLDVIVKAFCEAGYRVNAEVCSARGLTATGRKRLFFVGIREDLSIQESEAASTAKKLSLDDSCYRFPFIPDLKLCAHDILDYNTLDRVETEILTLTEETFEQLSRNSRWKPHHLAWPNKHCDTLTSHYGNAVGRGDSQLVPSPSPYPPRRFSVRECSRIMGFPNDFQFVDIRQGQGNMAYRKQCYRMLGNAVCPPLIAALAGSVLDAAGVKMDRDSISWTWTQQGLDVAIKLSSAALRPGPTLSLPGGCLFWHAGKEWPERCRKKREREW